MTDYNEDPLESLLDEQSDDEFGMPEIRDKFDHGASEEKHGNLKTWSAEDFSSIYVRFYPHLVRHAKRYLSTDVQAEEVVQDAFLYMMTALPEIDSELGVLKFMKWKVRLLALDVIRATPNRRETLVDSFDDEQSAEETDSEIERADDMAVIGAALAKLNPRHREALIATVYEDKTSTEIAAQMQLSENATRQLVFRARAAFKKALIGEAEVAGKSVSEILSIAAKRATSGVRENARAMSMVLVLALGGALIANFAPFNSGQSDETTVLQAERGDSSIVNPPNRAQPPFPPGQNLLSENADSLASGAQNITEEKLETPSPTESGPVSSIVIEEAAEVLEPQSSEELKDETENEPPESGSSLQRSAVSATALALGDEVLGRVIGTVSTEFRELSSYGRGPGLPNYSGYSIELLSSESGVTAVIDISRDGLEVSGLPLKLEDGNGVYYGYPASIGKSLVEDGNRSVLTVSASEFSFVDFDGNVISDHSLKNRFVNVTLVLDEFHRVASATLAVSS